MTFKCPYVDTKIYCDRRESINDETYACDSCTILFPEMYSNADEKEEDE